MSTTAPPATRVTRAGWRDPRLWIGVLLVAGSVVLGARVLAAADDMVPVWAVADDLGVGSTLTEDELVPVRVRFDDAGDVDRYFRADQPLPSGRVLVRGVGAGELLPRAAVGDAAAARTVRLPLDIEPHRVPPGVDAGSVVDVWVGGTGRRADPSGGPALSAVTVVEAPPVEESFAVSGTRQLVLAVADDEVGSFLTLLDGAQDPVVRVVQRS